MFAGLDVGVAPAAVAYDGAGIRRRGDEYEAYRQYSSERRGGSTRKSMYRSGEIRAGDGDEGDGRSFLSTPRARTFDVLIGVQSSLSSPQMENFSKYGHYPKKRR